MPVTVLYPEARQQPDELERGIFGADVRIVKRDTGAFSELSDADCAEADGLMIMGFGVTGADLARFPRLRAIIRMGVGYDKLDRPAAAARNVLICNVPDYGTTEVADHAIALALTLRRGILLHHELQRKDPPAPFRSFQNPMIERLGTQTFGIIGLGRIGTAVALRAKAFNFRVVFYDPYLPNGAELALGISRAATLEDLLRQTNTLSIHAPLTPETRNLLGREQFALMPKGAVVVNDARGAIIDVDALYDALKDGHLAGAGLDVLPQEPPLADTAFVEAVRRGEPWTIGRVIVTPHAAWYSRDSYGDLRRKAALVARDFLRDGRLRDCVNRQFLPAAAS